MIDLKNLEQRKLQSEILFGNVPMSIYEETVLKNQIVIINSLREISIYFNQQEKSADIRFDFGPM